MGRIRTSAADAFFLRIRDHQVVLYRYALRLTGRPDAAADLAQETLVKAFLRMSCYDPSRPLLPWLLAILRNLFIDTKREFDPLRGAEDIPSEQPADTHGPDLSEAASQSERSSAVQQAILMLPFEQRSIIILYHLEGRSLDEIAETEGMPVGTVKSRLFRARETLGKALRAHGPITGKPPARPAIDSDTSDDHLGL